MILITWDPEPEMSISSVRKLESAEPCCLNNTLLQVSFICIGLFDHNFIEFQIVLGPHF